MRCLLCPTETVLDSEFCEHQHCVVTRLRLCFDSTISHHIAHTPHTKHKSKHAEKDTFTIPFYAWLLGSWGNLTWFPATDEDIILICGTLFFRIFAYNWIALYFRGTRENIFYFICSAEAADFYILFILEINISDVFHRYTVYSKLNESCGRITRNLKTN